MVEEKYFKTDQSLDQSSLGRINPCSCLWRIPETDKRQRVSWRLIGRHSFTDQGRVLGFYPYRLLLRCMALAEK